MTCDGLGHVSFSSAVCSNVSLSQSPQLNQDAESRVDEEARKAARECNLAKMIW